MAALLGLTLKMMSSSKTPVFTYRYVRCHSRPVWTHGSQCLNDAKWIHLTVLWKAGNVLLQRPMRIETRIRRSRVQWWRSWPWKLGWGAKRKENKAQKEKEREEQSINVPWHCASRTVCTLDVSVIQRFDLWVFQCLQGCMLLLHFVSSAEDRKFWRHCTNCRRWITAMSKWHGDHRLPREKEMVYALDERPSTGDRPNNG